MPEAFLQGKNSMPQFRHLWGTFCLRRSGFLLVAIGLLWVQHSTAQTIPSPQIPYLSLLANGSPNAYGCVKTFVSGTSSPLTTYTDATGSTPNSNPVILSTNGTAQIWLTPGIAYQYQVYSFGGVNCATGSLVATIKGISGGTSQTVTAISSSATPTFPVTAQNQLFTFTLTQNAVAQPLTFTGISAPAIITFQISQNNIGGYTFTWPSNVTGGAAVNSTANNTTTQMFIWNGTTATAIGPAEVGPNSSGTQPNLITGNLTVNGSLILNGFSPPLVLCKLNTQVVHTGDTTTDTIFTCPIPVLSANSTLRLTLSWKPTVQGSPTSTLIVNFGGTSLFENAFSSSGTYANVDFLSQGWIFNTNSVSAQKGVMTNMMNAAYGQIVSEQANTSAINTGVTTNLIVTMQNGSNSDSQNFDSLVVEVL